MEVASSRNHMKLGVIDQRPKDLNPHRLVYLKAMGVKDLGHPARERGSDVRRAERVAHGG